MRAMRRPAVPTFAFASLLVAAVGAAAGCSASRRAQQQELERLLGPVGRRDDGTARTPVNQTLTPHGTTIELPGLRPVVLAQSADGSRLYVAGKTSELLVLAADDGAVLQRVPLPSDVQRTPPALPSERNLQPDEEGQASYTGLCVAPDGRRIWLANSRGSIKVFDVAADGTVAGSHSLPLPPANAPRRVAEVPSGLCLSADGTGLFVCGNLGNRLLELDAGTGAVRRSVAVGTAPYDVRRAGGLLFVSNWGGPRPGPGDLVGPAGRGTTVRVDPVRHIASEGSVSVVDLQSFTVRTETRAGLHSSALAVAPDGRFVVCANAGSDTLTVLDAGTGALVETIWARSSPADLLSATPNALCFAPDGSTLYAANGTQNAVGVFAFDPDDRGDSRLVGQIPVGWFPGALLYDRGRDRLVVANLKGLGQGRPRADSSAVDFNSRRYQGSLSLVPLPGRDELEVLSAAVATNQRRAAIEQTLLPPRPGQPPRVIPERIGEPSCIRHVVYVIKENRTYDQVLGDLTAGNGDAALCIFGERVTPNQHALAREFVLLDNTYCSGILSADGHQWSTAAFATDYLEKSFAGFPRSYPDGMGEDESDALSYSPAGFLWDHALAAGITLRNYGEFCAPDVRWRDPARQGEPGVDACWRSWRGIDDAVVFGCTPMIPSLLPCSSRDYVGWNMAVPDQYRADCFLRELAQYEQRGEFPQLVLICLPNDHTSGTGAGRPTPAACAADNDLAFGRIVEALSRSRFWPQMVVLGIEDDPQDGWDHVSGYRTTAYVASPYARRGATVSTQYNTTSIVRTIEQILGLPPMNVFDASATPLFDCFTATPDFTPFRSRTNNVALDDRNPAAAAIADPQLRADAEASLAMNLREVDRAPEDLLNRILWRAMRGTAAPYPVWAVTVGADDDDR